MNPGTMITGTHTSYIDISDNPGIDIDASGSVDERPITTPWYRSDDAKKYWRGLAVVSLGTALGAGGEMLGNSLALQRDGYWPLHTIGNPQPLLGAVMGFGYGFILAVFNEALFRPIMKVCLENRTISTPPSQPAAITTRVEIPADHNAVGDVSAVVRKSFENGPDMV